MNNEEEERKVFEEEAKFYNECIRDLRNNFGPNWKNAMSGLINFKGGIAENHEGEITIKSKVDTQNKPVKRALQVEPEIVDFGSDSEEEKDDRPIKLAKRDEAIDSAFCDRFRVTVNEALARVATDMGLASVKLENIRYNNSIISGKISAVAIKHNEDGSEMSEGQVRWNKYCDHYGLKADDWGKTIFLRGDKLTLVDIKKNNKKYPIIARKGERNYKLDVSSVKEKLVVKQ